MAKRAKHLGPARRRPMVLDAALAVFSEAGFTESSMETIARRAGITKPVLYDCFPDGKSEIYQELLAREEERFLDHMLGVLAATNRLPLREALRSGLLAFMAYAEIHPASFGFLFGAAGPSDPGVIQSFIRVRERLVEMMSQRAAADGAASPVVQQVYTRSILAISDHLARWWVREKPMERDLLVELIVDWLMRGFDGILPQNLK